MFNTYTRYSIGPRTSELTGSANAKIIEFIRAHGGSFSVKEIDGRGAPVKFILADGLHIETGKMDDVEGWDNSNSFIFWSDEHQYFIQTPVTAPVVTPVSVREALYNPISLHSVTIHEVLNSEQDRVNLIKKLQRLTIK